MVRLALTTGSFANTAKGSGSPALATHQETAKYVQRRYGAIEILRSAQDDTYSVGAALCRDG